MTLNIISFPVKKKRRKGDALLFNGTILGRKGQRGRNRVNRASPGNYAGQRGESETTSYNWCYL